MSSFISDGFLKMTGHGHWPVKVNLNIETDFLNSWCLTNDVIATIELLRDYDKKKQKLYLTAKDVDAIVASLLPFYEKHLDRFLEERLTSISESQFLDFMDACLQTRKNAQDS